MSQSEQTLPPFLPHAALECFWKSFGTTARLFEPVLRGATQANLELLGLAGNRARASLDYTSSLARCRSPQAVAAAQMEFWRTANSEYMAAAQRIAEIWRVPLQLGARAPSRERDVISFAEPRADMPVNGSRRKDDRQAA